MLNRPCIRLVIMAATVLAILVFAPWSGIFSSRPGESSPRPRAENIYMGDDVAPKTYNFVVQLERRRRSRAQTYCTGSIVTWGVILTAQHCLNKEVDMNKGDRVFVIAGGKHLEQKPDERYIQRREVKDYVVSWDYDIAIAILDAPFIPTRGYVERAVFDPAYVVELFDLLLDVGWGVTKIDSTRAPGSTTLKRGMVLVTEINRYNQFEEFGSKIPPSLLFNDEIKTQAERSSFIQMIEKKSYFGGAGLPCHGDSGSPIVNPLTNAQVGLDIKGTCSDKNVALNDKRAYALRLNEGSGPWRWLVERVPNILVRN